MELTELVQLSLIGILTVVVSRQALAMEGVQRSWRDHLATDHAMDLGHGSESDHDEPNWPSTDYLLVGRPVSSHIAAILTSRWALLILVKADCEACTTILAGLNDVRPMVLDYELHVLTVGTVGTPSAGDWVVISEPDAAFLPTPSAFLVDPLGVVQGRGTLLTTYDLVVFVADGRHHGIGPGLVPVADD